MATGRNEGLAALPEGVAEQARRARFCMRRLQAYNWGTFHGLHDIAISERGFLFVGRSGSGKSTLLDAIATLITPPKWLSYNAAAREGDRSRRDRNLASYVRGAWGDRTDESSGEIATRYLRRGTTWSAIALTFADGDGRKVSLVHLYWIKGAGAAAADVRKHFFIVERDFDVARELHDFDLDVRAFKRRLQDADHFGDNFSRYAERFRRLLRIDSEQALKLLHKTQSAKNLGDLNAFLREFMLERPDTFDAADRLVAEFDELDAAHREVVNVRRQVECLRPARDAFDCLRALDRAIAGGEGLLQGMDAWLESRRIGLLDAAIADERARLRGLEGEIRHQEERKEQAQSALRGLQALHRERGGERIERLKAALRDAERLRDERMARRAAATEACRTLGWTLAECAQAFGEQTGKARAIVESWRDRETALEEERDRLRDELQALEREFAELRGEIEAMERQPSNIPARMIALRREIAKGAGCAESELPFVGELLQVREADAGWRGAIERVLHGFALSMLVDVDRYAAISEYVDGHDLRGRLVYYRVGDHATGGVAPGPDSLVRKLDVKPTAFQPWLGAELRRRFDYACVENLRDFRARERALTRAGQVRHGKGRHEKDDRSSIDDRRRWVLGFDNREKLALYRARAGEVANAIAGVQQRMKTLRADRERERERMLACQRLANLEWRDIDAGNVLDRIAAIEEQLSALREGNRDLRELDAKMQAREESLRGVEKKLIDLRARLRNGLERLNGHEDELGRARERLALLEAPEDGVRKELDRRLSELEKTLSLSQLDRLRGKVERRIQDELKQQREERGGCQRVIERVLGDFRREWPEAAADMDATLASMPDALALLQRLERDGLPRHEKRFFDMLRDQSGENLAALMQRLKLARKDIHARMETVNEGLAGAGFNAGTHLRIKVNDRHLPDVREFNRQAAEVLGHALRDDRRAAEQRFLKLKTLVSRLIGSTPEDKRWRELVLDVRQHVDFIGYEYDADGREVETYRSGAGKSGGQREKLATTCLAAALRYQLGGEEGGLPVYAPVVLDEAFGKADNEFTEQALGVFEKFGFQIVVATPLKAVMALEPFIGGACFVDITERKHSATMAIDYDEGSRRLDLPGHGQKLSD